MTRRSDPFADIEELLDAVTGGLEPAERGGGLPVDVADTGEAFVVVADLPGHDRADIDVTLPDETTLAIGAERDTDRDVERYVTRERSGGSVTRRVGLPDAVEETEAGATYEDGVLAVTLPRRSGGSEDETEIPVE